MVSHSFAKQTQFLWQPQFLIFSDLSKYIQGDYQAQIPESEPGSVCLAGVQVRFQRGGAV